MKWKALQITGCGIGKNVKMDNLIYNSNDTICAISTAPGVGGIAVARISGAQAFDIMRKIWIGKDLDKVPSHTAHLGKVLDSEGQDLDHGVVTVFRTPTSFTGEDVIEISVHGSRWIQAQLIRSLIAAGCRMALPGEFTRRAFASGRLDLAQAEAVADMIASSSRAAHRLAMSQMRGTFSKKIDAVRDELLQLASLLELELDFSEEDVEFASRSRLLELSETLSDRLQKMASSFKSGEAIKDGVPIAIIGRTNAGKSSLLNALVADDRAIVSDIHGTTRDVVEDTAVIGDYLVRFQDTAGIRDTDDPIESIGIERSRRAARNARLVLYVLDSKSNITPQAAADELSGIDCSRLIIVANKIDAVDYFDSDVWAKSFPEAKVVHCSALFVNGLDDLRQIISDRLNAETSDTDIIVTNARHAQALAEASESLRSFALSIRQNIPTDLAAQDLRHAIYSLSSITGTISTPEILQNIFSKFCVGK